MVPVFDRRKLRPLILALAIALCAFQLTTCTGMWLLDPLIVRPTGPCARTPGPNRHGRSCSTSS